jgi:NADH-quinone oxidoreductase subunit E
VDDGVTVEFVECLASCGSGPVVMIDEELHERVDVAHARGLCERIKAEVAAGAGKLTT